MSAKKQTEEREVVVGPVEFVGEMFATPEQQETILTAERDFKTAIEAELKKLHAAVGSALNIEPESGLWMLVVDNYVADAYLHTSVYAPDTMPDGYVQELAKTSIEAADNNCLS